MAKTTVRLVICNITTKAEELIRDAVEGEEILRRAKEKIVFAKRRHCKLVLEGKIKIPRDWRKYDLLFPEVWQDRGVNFVDYLQSTCSTPSGWRLVHHNIDA